MSKFARLKFSVIQTGSSPDHKLGEINIEHITFMISQATGTEIHLINGEKLYCSDDLNNLKRMLYSPS